MSDTKNNKSLWTRNFIIITIINLLIYCCWQMFPPSLPPYLKSLGGSDSILGWINGVATIATLVIRPFSGKVMDRFGRKGIFIFGLIFMAITTILYNFSAIIAIIVGIRFFHGIAWGIASTASNTVATDNIPTNQMGQGMAYFSLSISLATAIAPALALSLPINNMVRLATSLVVVAIVLSFMMSYSPVDKAYQSAGKNASPYEKKSLAPAILMFLISTTYGAIITFIALFAKEKGIENIGMFFTLYAVGMLVTRPFLGQIIDKKGFSVVIMPGAILILLSLILLSNAESLSGFLVSGAIYGIGYGALQTCLQTMSVMSAPPNRMGAANATFFTGFDGGIGFGAIIAGALSSQVGYGSMFLVLGICPIIVLLSQLYSSRAKK